MDAKLPPPGETVVSLMLDPQRQTCKPSSDDKSTWFAIHQACSRNVVTGPVSALSEALCSGQTCCLGVFNGERQKSFWLQQQLFGLDFDKDITFDEYLAEAERYDVLPAFCYATFNHAPEHHRFRAIYVCDQVIEDPRVAHMVQILLMRLHTTKSYKPDVKCKDSTRLYLGTNKGLLYENYEARVNPIQVHMAVCHSIYDRDASHAARDIEQVNNSCDIEFSPSEIVVFDVL